MISSVTVQQGEDAFQYVFQNRTFHFELHPKVARPNYASSFFIENMPTANECDAALDLGTGCGFFPVVLSSAHDIRHVVAIDINPFAVSLAQRNLSRTKSRLTFSVIEGDLFEPVIGRTFDLITCLPPYMPTPSSVFGGLINRDGWYFHWSTSGGEDGREVITRVIRGAPEHLYKGGRLYIAHADYVDVEKTLNEMESVGLKPKIEARRYFPLGSLGRLRQQYIEQHLGFVFQKNDDQEPLQELNLISGTLE